MEGLIFGILRYFFKEMYANQSGELYVDIGVKRVNGTLCQVDTSLQVAASQFVHATLRSLYLTLKVGVQPQNCLNSAKL